MKGSRYPVPLRPAANAAGFLVLAACLSLAGCIGTGRLAGPRVLVFHLYGYGSEPSTTAALTELKGLPGPVRVVLHDMRKAENGNQYSDLYNFLSTRLGIRILPDQIEHRIAPPVIHLSNEMRYFSQFLQPLVSVMRGGKLVAAVVGSDWYGPGFWERLSRDAPEWTDLHVFTLNTTTTVTDTKLTAEMARIIR